MSYSSWITRAAGWAVGVFHEVEVAGGGIPDGPVLVVANHPNSLLDPLVLFRVAGRPTRPLAKAPLFEQALLGTVLRGLGGLPVFRRQDDPALMHRNDETFRRAIEALTAGDAVQIYPEGKSHSESSLVPLRTGAARIALGAERAAGWGLALHMVPVGLTYSRKARFRGRVLATIGAAFTITDLRAADDADPVEAARTLTERIARALEEVTLNVPSADDVALVDTAERIHARETGLAGWREREPLARRLPRMQAFAHGMHWLRTYDPARYQALARAVRRHRRKLALLGVDEGDVPPEYQPWAVTRYVLRNGALLALGLPFALAGALLWYPLWLVARITVALVRPEYEAVATYKLAGAVLAAPVVWLAHIALAAWLGGPIVAAVAAVATPMLGLVALAWHGVWRRAREDASLFGALFRGARARNRIAHDRAELVRAFEEVEAQWRSAVNASSAQPIISDTPPSGVTEPSQRGEPSASA